MGRLSTHVLDTANGRPAAGVAIRLARVEDGQPVVIAETVTNQDGRTDTPLLSGGAYRAGTYVITFEVRAYFERKKGVGTCPFLDEIPLRFTITEPDGHYHVPLLVSPWSFSTYRGS
jgi:5-hydroxyisourate hydrolase